MFLFRMRKFSNKLNKTNPHPHEDLNPPSEIKHLPQIACYTRVGFSSKKKVFYLQISSTFSHSAINKGRNLFVDKESFKRIFIKPTAALMLIISSLSQRFELSNLNCF